MDYMQTRIYDLVKAKPGLTSQQIAAILFYDLAMTVTVIRELVKEGAIERRLGGRGRLYRHYIAEKEAV